MRKGSLTSEDLCKDAQFFYDKFIKLFNENFEDALCMYVIDDFDKLLETIKEDSFTEGYDCAKERITTEFNDLMDDLV